jgi:hypothetical protein
MNIKNRIVHGAVYDSVRLATGNLLEIGNSIKKDGKRQSPIRSLNITLMKGIGSMRQKVKLQNTIHILVDGNIQSKKISHQPLQPTCFACV